MYQTKVRETELAWTAPGFPGVMMKVLHKDESTGVMAVLTRMEPGSVIPAHWHTKADETVYVLDGDFVEDGETFRTGSYFRGRARTIHGPHSTVEGCTVLTHFSAELDFYRAEQVPEGG
jgi:anti-sigma factor ChrR (cupin superfamily)